MVSPVNTQSPPKLPKAGFWVALVIFLVSAIVGIVMIVVSVGSIANTINDFAEIDVPQSAQVQLSSGEYWVFEGTTLNSLAAGSVDVTVTDPNGSSLNLSSDFNQYNATSSGQQFTSLGKFNVPSAGVYTFETAGPSDATVRVGRLPISRIVGLLFGGIAVGAIGFLVAVILFIVTLVRRGSAKKRRVAAGYPAAGAPPTGYAPMPAPTGPPTSGPAPAAPPVVPPPAPAVPAPAAPPPAPVAPTPAPPAPAPAPPPPAPAGPAPTSAPPAPAPAPPPPAPAGPAPTPPPTPGPPPPPGAVPSPPAT